MRKNEFLSPQGDTSVIPSRKCGVHATSTAPSLSPAGTALPFSSPRRGECFRNALGYSRSIAHQSLPEESLTFETSLCKVLSFDHRLSCRDSFL